MIVDTHRARLLEVLEGVPLVLSAYDSMQLSGDMAAPFLQEANFLWLTGITSPGWWVVLTSERTCLVAPEVDAAHQLFDGELSFQEAKELSGIDEVLSRQAGEEFLKELAVRHEVVYTLGKDPHAEYYDFSLNPAPLNMERKLQELFKTVKDARPLIAKLRAIKSDDELAVMREAIALTTETFAAIKERLSDFQYEYEIEAEFNKAFRATGGEGHAYAPIVASGEHACTLHYGKNNAALPANGLVLIDVGGRIGGYAADITRTYAVGTPTERQKAVHAAVEKAHHDSIALIKPGLSVKTYHQEVDKIMKSALKSLGLLKSPKDYRRYFPHAISHGLGIDVHDALGAPEVFKPGMVLTVEPGIYIPEEGIGVRIEDDILVTEDGHENLSAALPTGL